MTRGRKGDPLVQELPHGSNRTSGGRRPARPHSRRRPDRRRIDVHRRRRYEHAAPGHEEEPHRVRVGRCRIQCRPGGDRGRAAGAARRRQRGRRRGGDGRGAGRDRAVLGRHRWRWLLRLLRREDPARAHHRRSRDGAEQHDRSRVPQTRRGGVPARRGGDQRLVRRRARHPGHMGAGSAAVGSSVAGRQPAPGHPDRRARLRGRRDVPQPDAGQQSPLRADHSDGGALPARG